MKDPILNGAAHQFGHLFKGISAAEHDRNIQMRKQLLAAKGKVPATKSNAYNGKVPVFPGTLKPKRKPKKQPPRIPNEDQRLKAFPAANNAQGVDSDSEETFVKKPTRPKPPRRRPSPTA